MKRTNCLIPGLALLLTTTMSAFAAPGTASAPGAPAPMAGLQIKSCQPNEVPCEEKLTINGAGFSTNPKDMVVQIGDKTAVPTAASATSIQLVVPKNVKPGKTKVTVFVGKTRSNDSEVTILMPPPELDSLSLSSASPGGSLTISGKNFSTNARENTVTIGGATAEVHGASNTSLSVTIPSSIESPQEAEVTVKVGKQSAKHGLPIMIQSREF